jgi:hypothetical protein
MSLSDDELNLPFITHMESVAIEIHEMYLHLKQAGFTQKEALFIVGIAVGEGIMAPVYSNYSNLDSDSHQDDPEDDSDFGDDLLD